MTIPNRMTTMMLVTTATLWAFTCRFPRLTTTRWHPMSCASPVLTKATALGDVTFTTAWPPIASVGNPFAWRSISIKPGSKRARAGERGERMIKWAASTNSTMIIIKTTIGIVVTWRIGPVPRGVTHSKRPNGPPTIPWCTPMLVCNMPISIRTNGCKWKIGSRLWKKTPMIRLACFRGPCTAVVHRRRPSSHFCSLPDGRPPKFPPVFSKSSSLSIRSNTSSWPRGPLSTCKMPRRSKTSREVGARITRRTKWPLARWSNKRG
mmetsp:Transcript_17927/g.42305  ORF Transcript_17927/g.42305 Transcript_17927/m.42305 type:complete len:264 (-) Transcript_17927:1130-1921(-)